MDMDNMFDIDIESFEAAQQMKRLPAFSREKFQQLQSFKEELVSIIKELRFNIEKYANACQYLQNETGITEDRKREMVVQNKQMEDDVEYLRHGLDRMNLAIKDTDEDILGLFNPETSKAVAMMSFNLVQNYMEFKSMQRIENGINSMNFRIDELKKKMLALEKNLELFKNKLQQVQK